MIDPKIPDWCCMAEAVVRSEKPSLGRRVSPQRSPSTPYSSPNTYSSCFNHADRLVSTTEPGFTGTIAYDTHGNMTTVAGETRSYDIADRHTSTTKGAVTVTYVRDVTDRIVARTDSTGTTRFGFTAGGDSAGLTLTSANVLVERTMGLPGGVMLTTRSSGNVWSYPNWHGDHVATANQAGAKQGGTASYDPFGNLTSGTPVDNGAGALDYGWHGQAQRPLDTTAGLTPTIEMGARQYLPQLGRFIEQDPIEGGVDNDYTYVTDPINGSDLNGMWGWSSIKSAWKATKNFVKKHEKGLRQIANVTVFVAGVAGGLACAASVVCGVAVGAAAGAASYAATNAGTDKFSWGGLGRSALIGGAIGGAGSYGTKLVGAGGGLVSRAEGRIANATANHRWFAGRFAGRVSGILNSPVIAVGRATVSMGRGLQWSSQGSNVGCAISGAC